MGAAPSRECITLFSYFRGSYEVGLIPLTKHYFGNPDQVDVNDLEGKAVFGSTSSVARRSPEEVEKTKKTMWILRQQLIQMRKDPAVLYANGRDRANMIETLKQHVKEQRALAAERQKRQADDAAAAAETADATKPKEANPSSFPPADVHDPPLSEEAMEELLGSLFWDVMPQPNFGEDDLDAFLDLVDEMLYPTDEAMVTDPRYRKGPAPLSKAAAAAADAGGDDDDDAPGAGLKEEGEMALTAAEAKERKLPPFFMPIPCALCLAYPEGKERQGCFELDGRNVNIIGYFGLMTRQMECVFKIQKYSEEGHIAPPPAAAAAAAAEEGAAPPGANVYLECDPEDPEDRERPFQLGGKCELLLNTNILTSAGDRTLERVLVLAAVMLRHQFHTVYRRVMIMGKIHQYREAERQAAGGASGERGQPPAGALDPAAQPMTWSDLMMRKLETQLPFTLRAGNLPPLPVQSFTPYPCYEGSDSSNSYPPPHLRLNVVNPLLQAMQSTQSLVNNNNHSGNNPAMGGHASSDYLPLLTNPLGPPVMGFTPSVPQALAPTLAEEDTITWGLFHRLDSIGVHIEVASNNYSSLKSLTENFAFLHCQVLIDASEGHVELRHVPRRTGEPPSEHAASEKDKEKEKGEAGTASPTSASPAPSSASPEKAIKEEAEGEAKPGPHFVLSPASTIVLSMRPSYFRQAALWASSLFHYPAPLHGGNWIQYKLKDESEQLRLILQSKDTLIALWRHKEVERAGSYLGPRTARVLAHVRSLQEETEAARKLSVAHWTKYRIYENADGRKYAVHPSRFGTMLIGVRAHSHTNTGSGGGGGGHKDGNKGEGGAGGGASGCGHHKEGGGHGPGSHRSSRLGSKKNSYESRLNDLAPPGGMPMNVFHLNPNGGPHNMNRMPGSFNPPLMGGGFGGGAPMGVGFGNGMGHNVSHMHNGMHNHNHNNNNVRGAMNAYGPMQVNPPGMQAPFFNPMGNHNNNTQMNLMNNMNHHHHHLQQQQQLPNSQNNHFSGSIGLGDHLHLLPQQPPQQQQQPSAAALNAAMMGGGMNFNMLNMNVHHAGAATFASNTNNSPAMVFDPTTGTLTPLTSMAAPSQQPQQQQQAPFILNLPGLMNGSNGNPNAPPIFMGQGVHQHQHQNNSHTNTANGIGSGNGGGHPGPNLSMLQTNQQLLTALQAMAVLNNNNNNNNNTNNNTTTTTTNNNTAFLLSGSPNAGVMDQKALLAAAFQNLQQQQQQQPSSQSPQPSLNPMAFMPAPLNVSQGGNTTNWSTQSQPSSALGSRAASSNAVSAFFQNASPTNAQMTSFNPLLGSANTHTTAMHHSGLPAGSAATAANANLGGDGSMIFNLQDLHKVDQSLLTTASPALGINALVDAAASLWSTQTPLSMGGSHPLQRPPNAPYGTAAAATTTSEASSAGNLSPPQQHPSPTATTTMVPPTTASPVNVVQVNGQYYALIDGQAVPLNFSPAAAAGPTSSGGGGLPYVPPASTNGVGPNAMSPAAANPSSTVASSTGSTNLNPQAAPFTTNHGSSGNSHGKNKNLSSFVFQS